MNKNSDLYIVCLKSFGDLIIARYALKNFSKPGVTLIIGDHLVELNSILGSFDKYFIINHGEGDVPAVYDINKRGKFKAFFSGIYLRKLFNNKIIPKNALLLFDKTGFRERIVAGDLKLTYLPKTENIYIAYRNFFSKNGFSYSNTHESVGVVQKYKNIHPVIGIFPGSRLPKKSIPALVIEKIVLACRLRSIKTVVYLLEGESIDIGNVYDSVVNVPRQFSAMADAVQSVQKIISADSMPAHLGEYFNLPVFVATPVENKYWLPISAYTLNYWSTFAEISYGDCIKLNTFLDSL